jgi:putative transcriptional regulator
MYKTIEIDRDKLTILGVQFPNITELNKTANALGSNMFEGFEPSKELIELYLEWKSGDISEDNFLSTLYKLHGK